MKLPRDPEELIPMLAAFGAASALGRLLASPQVLTWRIVLGRALEGSLLCMCAGVGLLFFKDAPPLAILGIGGLLASFGVSGAIAVVKAWRGSK